MKTIVCYWHPSAQKAFEEAGFTQNQEVSNEDTMNIAMALFNAGLNVMLLHGSEYNIIATDTKKFGQR